MNATNTTKSRKSYQKPQLECVRLVVQEAVLANCKMSGFAGSGVPAGSACINVGNCVNIGS